MYIYNVTFSVDKEIVPEFIEYVKSVFIPASLECAGFSNPLLTRVLHEIDPKTTNHTVQFHVESVEDINYWYEDKGSLLFSNIMDIWSTKVVFFQTALEVIE